ncbi:hypothetical protein AQ1_02329 [alpha proteobacterium Q-1]|uniref:hypothetical protein n=1 Tax=Iodidimonas nitroreducens TaxID=1236968 RepID=UPI00049FD939|nr:hypothetical protein [Iodidimonas nitroreducens]GAK34430.1 hypothetical protein AQ1_02329 [alpha proteobacterium Q-1]
MDENTSKESYLSKHKKLHQENSVAFREEKAKLTYYMLSLPFALASVAIASFQYPEHWVLIVIEITAWILFLCAGASGLVAKQAIVERYRVSSLKHSTASYYIEINHVITNEDYDLSFSRENAILRAEKVEYKAESWHKWFLIAGSVAWLISRTLIAVMVALGAVGATGN